MSGDGKPYKLLDLVQGSKEWIDTRFNYITASNVSSILNKNPYKNASTYFQELVLREEKPYSSYQKGLFEHGHKVEEKARIWLENDRLIKYPAVVMVSESVVPLLCSLDGFNAEHNIMLEVKFVGSPKRFEEISAGVIPPHHMYQIQSCLLTSGAAICLYFVCNGERSFLQEILPDKEIFKEISEAVPIFWERIKTRNADGLEVKKRKKVIGG
jgi:putative phage-type endonuclease